MRYVDLDCDPRVAPWVANLWSLTTTPSRAGAAHMVPPDGCTHLACSGDEVVMVGPQTVPYAPPLRRARHWFGVRFHPGAARAFLGVPRTLPLRNRTIIVARVPALTWLAGFGQSVAAAGNDEDRLAAATAWLVDHATCARRVDPVIAEAVSRITAPATAPTIRAVARFLGLSERQLRRRFAVAVDLSPSVFRGIWRFRRCAVDLVATPGIRWSTRAAHHGYADQSHLTREFRRLVGLTPQGFARQTAAITHGALRFPDITPPPSARPIASRPGGTGDTILSRSRMPRGR